MIETTFLVPIANNDGRPFTDPDFVQLENLLLGTFDAWTRLASVQGAWRGEAGVVYHDSSRQYAVALSSWRRVVDFIQVLD